MSASMSGSEGAGRRGTVLAVDGLMLALFLVALDQTVVGTASSCSTREPGASG